MNDFKLEPVDVLVNVNRNKDPYSVFKRRFLGPYDHVFLYLGAMDFAPLEKPPLRIPMLFESNGRGVVIQSLSNRYGQEVVVMRLKSKYNRKEIPWVLEEAIKLASDNQAYYDYLCIIKFAIPRLICEKLRIPMPLKYHRDQWHICSEAVFEVFYRAKLFDILYPYCLPPLPGDFVNETLLLEKVWSGILSEGVV